MRAVVQRVANCNVVVDGDVVSEIGTGLMVLVAVTDTDTKDDIAYLADKVTNLRIFSDADDKMNLSVRDVKGQILAVSQFTLYGDARKGRRPNFMRASAGDFADARFGEFVEALRSYEVPVQTGVFGAHMEVTLTNDGPVTILLDSDRSF